MTGWMELLAWAGLGYLAGSIPFGLLLTRLAGLGDVRSIGSGNIGATNVLRTGRKGLAAATLLLDGLKATIPILMALSLGNREAGYAAAAGAIAGHCFPVWLRFKGGKGVATFIGCLLGLEWRAALAFSAVWLAVAAVTRYSSLAGLLASLSCAFVPWALGDRATSLVLLGLVLLLWAKHHANIARLLSGTEPRIGRQG